MSKTAMKYLKPGAIVPVDVQTTALLVNALREALAEQDVQYTGNGTAGREADVRPTGFFFQSHRQAQQESDT